jgi:hypothetical protein
MKRVEKLSHPMKHGGPMIHGDHHVSNISTMFDTMKHDLKTMKHHL